MLEAHDVSIKDQGQRIELLEKEHKEFKQQMSSFELDLSKVMSGQASLETTVMKDGKETRELLKTAFNHILKVDEQKGKYKLRQLDAKTKITLGAFSLLGGTAIWGGIATLISIF